MHHRLGDAEEHQADAHAGGEQHGEPGQGAVIRFAVIRPELDVAVTTERQQHHHEQDECNGEDVEPADVGDDPGLGIAKQRLRMALESDAVEHQRQDDDRRAVEDRGVEVGRRGLFCLHAALLRVVSGEWPPVAKAIQLNTDRKGCPLSAADRCAPKPGLEQLSLDCRAGTAGLRRGAGG